MSARGLQYAILRMERGGGPGPRSPLLSRVAGRMGMLAGVVLVLALTGGCFSSDPAGTDEMDADVTIEMTSDLVYAPAVATARVGETVRWVNSSNIPHTVTADPGLAANPQSVMLPAGAAPFDSGQIDAGGSYARTFDVAGTYRYFCRPHEGAGMIATIVVSE